MDATGETANTWSASQDCGEKQQIIELAQDLINSNAPLDGGYTFSSDLDFPTDYGFANDDDAHRIVQSAIATAEYHRDAQTGVFQQTTLSI
jgi:hypothetical protein